jgi:tRNA pseudouridine55 synthase
VAKQKQPSGWAGFINLDKPAGVSSGDCVYALRKLLKERRIGHGGTLDPAAIGVLPIAVGPMTRLLNYLPTGKAYRATIRFGLTTTTDDLEGDTLIDQPGVQLSQTDVEAFLPDFCGDLLQVPPIYSAIHKDGQRLYDLARQGKAPSLEELTPRPVRIESLVMCEWRSGDYPEAVIDVECSTGTYIRSIARDLGAKLGCGGTLAHLERTRSGQFRREQSISLETINHQLEAGTFQLIGPESALSHLSTCILDDQQVAFWKNGRAFLWSRGEGTVQVWSPENRFLGIGQCNDEMLSPAIVVNISD